MVREDESKRTRKLRVLFLIQNLLGAGRVECSLDILLERGEWLCAIDELRFCLTVDRIGKYETGCASYPCGLSITQILLDAVFVFTTAVTAVELIQIQSIDLLSDETEALIGEGTNIFTNDIPEEKIMQLPELVLFACTIRGKRGILRFSIRPTNVAAYPV